MILDDVEKSLREALHPSDIFGEGDWKKACKRLMAHCHPDKFLDPTDKNRATLIIQQLGDWKKLADTPETLKTGTMGYTLGRELAKGDVSTVRVAFDDNNKRYIVKISFPGAGRMLRQERDAIIKVMNSIKSGPHQRYLPAVVDSVKLPDSREVTVFEYMTGLFNIDEILQVHENGVSPKHIVWMFKRLMTALGYAHSAGICHGQILPPHLMYQIEFHGLKLVDWTLAVPVGKAMLGAPTKYKGWYPPECKNKKGITPATDIYMAAKCMILLAGGDPVNEYFPDSMPVEMQSYLRGCLLESQLMRPQNAWQCLEEFDDLARQLYGKPKFQTFSM